MNQHASTYQNVQSCVDISLRCHHVCLQTAMNHCLEAGGQYVEPEHFRLLMNCVEICQTCASFQLGSSAFCVQICKLCADVCEACANNCERVGGLESCVKACRDCAECCRTMVV